jgi:hypothetical protein
MYKIKKHNSSTVTSIGSGLKKNNRNTYDLDKKEKSMNSNENSLSSKEIKCEDIHGNSNKGHINNKTGKRPFFKAYPSDNLFKTFKDEFYSGIKINKAPTYYNNKMAINNIS